MSAEMQPIVLCPPHYWSSMAQMLDMTNGVAPRAEYIQLLSDICSQDESQDVVGMVVTANVFISDPDRGVTGNCAICEMKD